MDVSRPTALIAPIGEYTEELLRNASDVSLKSRSKTKFLNQCPAISTMGGVRR